MPCSDTDLTIPSVLAAAIRAVAEDEHRPAADVVRDALEGYPEVRGWRGQSER